VILLAACVTKPAETTTATPSPSTPAPETGKSMVAVSLADVGLDTNAIDRTVDPCDDFYSFACGGWLKSTPIPADKSRWSRSFSEIDKRNEAELRRILEDAAKKPGTDPVLLRIGAYYGACMDETAIEAAGLEPVTALLNQAAGVKDAATVAEAIITLHKSRIWALFDLSASQDFKDATKVVAYVDQNGLGLPDRDYYVNDDDRSKELRTKYVEHVKRTLGLAGFDTAAQTAAAADVLALETTLAKASKTRVERRDPAALYNKIDRTGLVANAPTFPWVRYFAELGREDIQDVVVTHVPFVKAVDELLRTATPAQWKHYLQWTVLRSTATFLPKRFVDESFAMSQALTGQTQIEDRWKRCVEATDGALGELLAQPWLAKMFGKASKEATELYVAEISKAFGAGLDSLAWMDDGTRAKARQKLETMVYKIGYPPKWKEYAFDVDAKTFAANALASRAFELQRDLAKIGKPVDRDEWFMSPPTVNAYYNAQLNEMVFPAGILQPPFFDAKASVAANLGGMGMVVGHELTHGFDDEGSKFAGDGNLSQWWDDETRKRFEEKAECVAKQYESFEPLPGLRINGHLTMGENIADIGGVKLAFRAYRNLRKAAKEEQLAEGFSEDQQFFLSVGQVWCMNAREQVAQMLLKVDPHSPPKFRVNGSLQNTPEFAAAFECEAGSRMKPANACAVW